MMVRQRVFALAVRIIAIWLRPMVAVMGVH